MENKVSRPLLLTGLIIALILFIALTFGSAYLALVFALFGGIAGASGSEASELVLMTMVFVFILIAAFSIIGIVFASISISRWKLPPQEFDKKKGIITTTFVFCVIIAVLELFGVFETFNVAGLIAVIILMIAATFIMVDCVKNKKLLKEEQMRAEMVKPQEEEKKLCEDDSIDVDKINPDAF